MGKCYNCDSEVILREEETRCDNCGEIIRYWCHSCKTPFDVEDSNKNKIHECKWCWFFKCPNCGICGPDCEKYEHGKKIQEFIPEINAEQIEKLLSYFEEIKNGKIKKICDFGVPKSYAKERIKNILAKLEGFKVKDMFDMNAFERRLKIVETSEKGKKFTIKTTKEAGSYGQEWRDIFNLGVCLGMLKWKRESIIKESKKIGEYDSWIRIKNEPCKYAQTNNIIVKYCSECKKIYPYEKEFCSDCKYTRGGKKHSKDSAYKLLPKISNIPICSVLNKFKKRGENVRNIQGSIGEIQEEQSELEKE